MWNLLYLVCIGLGINGIIQENRKKRLTQIIECMQESCQDEPTPENGVNPDNEDIKNDSDNLSGVGPV